MIELAAHQRAAVARVRELLSHYGGALLADDVGLGKSFVAAAVASGYRHTDLLFIVPATLVPQWQITPRDFELAAQVLTHDALARDLFVPDLTRERLIVVDEAHAFRNRKTLRWAALARRSIGARLLLVTATPVCNSLDDLASLIALISADDALRHAGVHSIDMAFRERDRGAIASIVATLVIRRERDVLPPQLRFGSLATELIRHPLPPVSIDTLTFPLIGESALLQRFLWRRLESSEEALLESADRQLHFYDRALDALRRGRALTKRDYRRAFGDDDSLQQILFWEIFAPPSATGDAAAIEAEMARLAILRREMAASPRTKLRLLREVVSGIADPLLIFTGHIATATAIFAALRDLRRCGLATARQGRHAIGAFVRGEIDVLVATDLAAEGLNLQRAGSVIHYDLPWNPVKLDQRNGRAHRIGQRRKLVRAICFVPEEERTRASEIVALKNERRMATLQPSSLMSRPFCSPLPPYIPRDCPVAALVRALDRKNLSVPPALLGRFRAGTERLAAELASEIVDEGRLSLLTDTLNRERELARS